MSYQTYGYQGPCDQFLCSDFIQVTGATSSYVTIYTVPAGFKGHVGSIRLRLNAGATAGAEVLTFQQVYASGATTATLCATPALNTAVGTTQGTSAFGTSALTAGQVLICRLNSGNTIQPTLQPGDQIQVACTTAGSVNEYHVDVTGLLIP